MQPAAQWTTETHAWPFDWYCIILLYPNRRIQHSINWYINFQAVNITGSMKLTWPPVTGLCDRWFESLRGNVQMFVHLFYHWQLSSASTEFFNLEHL
jgi:hypothetical protein